MKKAWRSVPKNPLIANLQRETPPGHCVFCKRPVRDTCMREKYVCFRADCQTSYNTEHVRWKRQQRTTRGLTQRNRKPKSKAPHWQQLREEVVTTWEELEDDRAKEEARSLARQKIRPRKRWKAHTRRGPQRAGAWRREVHVLR